MANPRTPIETLKLTGSTNLKRALSYPPEKRIAKQEEMEQLFADLKTRRKELLADIRENGLFVQQEKWSNGKNISIRVPNPAVRMLQTTERQLVQLSKLLGEPEPKEMSAAELIEQTDRLLAKAN